MFGWLQSDGRYDGRQFSLSTDLIRIAKDGSSERAFLPSVFEARGDPGRMPKKRSFIFGVLVHRQAVKFEVGG